MKTSLLILACLFIPYIANAGNAQTELSNFSIEIDGDPLILLPAISKAYASTQIGGNYNYNPLDPLKFNGDIDLTANLADATMRGYAHTYVDIDSKEANFLSELYGLGNASAGTGAYYVFEVAAGTTITLNAQATGFSNPVGRDLYRYGADLIMHDNKGHHFSDGLYNYGNNPFYLSFPISLTYFTPVDARLTISAMTYVYNYGTVAEPDRYGMMLLGMSALVLFARRKLFTEGPDIQRT